MREAFEVERYVSGRDDIEPEKLAYERAMFEGCVPSEFWYVTRADVQHNVEAFNNVVLPYRRRLRTAHARGYSILLTGDNGTGKTMFICYLLGRAVQMGYSIYYTTLKRLDANIKRGFDDKQAAQRLRSMLGADFVAIDELAKEHAKSEFLKSELEDWMKGRYDDDQPMLMASNMDVPTLTQMYGPTVASMLEGRFQQVELAGGDFRKKTRNAMRATMGFKD